LDRAVLRELWEFALIGSRPMPLALVAIDQNNSGILDFFMLWRTHRLQTRPVLERFRPAFVLSNKRVPRSTSHPLCAHRQ
jgi:hypothetical protein